LIRRVLISGLGHDENLLSNYSLLEKGFSPFSLGAKQINNQDSTSTTVTASTNPSVYGQPVTLTSKVSASTAGAGTPSGIVTFKDGTIVIGTQALNNIGVATLTTPLLSVESHSITAVYAGDNTFKTSTSAAFSQVVNKATTTSTLTSSSNSSIFGQSVTFTGSITANAPGAGIPSGTVSFKEGTTVLGTGILNAAGIATFSTTTLPVGNHSIKTVYDGDLNFTTSTSNAVSLSVIPNTTKIDTFANDSSSITIAFNKAIATTLLQINDSYSGSTLTEQADMIVTDSSNQPVKGSLIVAPDAKSIMFMNVGQRRNSCTDSWPDQWNKRSGGWSGQGGRAAEAGCGGRS
jgi:hypothetical protein